MAPKIMEPHTGALFLCQWNGSSRLHCLCQSQTCNCARLLIVATQSSHPNCQSQLYLLRTWLRGARGWLVKLESSLQYNCTLFLNTTLVACHPIPIAYMEGAIYYYMNGYRKGNLVHWRAKVHLQCLPPLYQLFTFHVQ